MALCLVLNSSGQMVTSPTDPASCSGVVALSAQEYTAFVGVSTLPASAELAAAFQAGFIIPATCFVVSYMVGRVVAVFNGDS